MLNGSMTMPRVNRVQAGERYASGTVLTERPGQLIVRQCDAEGDYIVKVTYDNGNLLPTRDPVSGISSAAFTPDYRHIALVQGKSVLIYAEFQLEYMEKVALREIPDNVSVSCVAITNNGMVIVGLSNGDVRFQLEDFMRRENVSELPIVSLRLMGNRLVVQSAEGLEEFIVC